MFVVLRVYLSSWIAPRLIQGLLRSEGDPGDNTNHSTTTTNNNNSNNTTTINNNNNSSSSSSSSSSSNNTTINESCPALSMASFVPKVIQAKP